MSKSRGNVLDPWDILASRGADALRWNLFSSGSPWTSTRVSIDHIDETTRRFLLTLWNTYAFFTTYANLDGWEPPPVPPRPTHVLDRWIRSRLHSTVREVADALEGFDALRGAQLLDRLVDDLSNWYVRRSRPRFWKASDAAAHTVLHECLTVVVRMLAPYCPFITDAIHRNLVGTSVHLADWPETDSHAEDRDLEAEMDLARRLVSLGLSARNDARLKVRQPLRRALIVGASGISESVLTEVSDALNVKAVETVVDLEGLLDYTVVANFRELGPRAGARMPAVQAALETVDPSSMRTRLDADGSYELTLQDGTTFELGPDDVEVRAGAHDDLALAREGTLAVALEVTLDDDLRLEGLARELARTINERRKLAGLELSERIRVTIHADDPIAEAAQRHAEWIAGEVLAVDWRVDPAVPDRRDGLSQVRIDGHAVGIALESA